jgi:hypothetical protein
MATPQLLQDLHQRAMELYAQGQLREAAQLLSDAIAENQTSELWNDWGAVQVRLGNFLDAERAFRCALRLDPAYGQAAENLGALLFAQRRQQEAIPFLQQALRAAPDSQSTELQKMLAQCGPPLSPELACALPSAQDPVKENSESASAARSTTPAADAVYKAPAPGTSTQYEDWFESVFKQRVPVPGVRIATSWPEDSAWGLRAHVALVQVECDYVRHLLAEIKEKQIAGDIAEFGIFEGWWVDFLWNTTESLGLKRRVYGFDSFEGLSEPHPEHDLSFWKKGQYACSLEQVSKNVQALTRPRIKLVKGFFEKSLRGADALLAEKFCYVRIDCDIYQPALDCLRYLGPRLADGAILVFDDWPHTRGYGEQRAFEEWLPDVPNLEFEFLFYGAIGHFYTRVHHKE